MKQRFNVKLWLIAGIAWAVFMYLSFLDFQLVWQPLDALIYLAGGIIWGLLTGYLFTLWTNKRIRSYEDYVPLLKKRLAKGKRLNKDISEFNLYERPISIYETMVLWDLFVTRLEEQEAEGIHLMDEARWFDAYTDALHTIYGGEQLDMDTMNHIHNLTHDLLLIPYKTLTRQGIFVIRDIALYIYRLCANRTDVVIPPEDEIDLFLLYYFVELRLGLVEIDALMEYVNQETLKDDVPDIIIDIQYATYKGKNEVISILNNHLQNCPIANKLYIDHYLVRCILYDVLHLYDKEEIAQSDAVYYIQELAVHNGMTPFLSPIFTVYNPDTAEAQYEEILNNLKKYAISIHNPHPTPQETDG